MHLCSLYRFPLKSSAAEPLQRADVERIGLAGDRRWMVVDAATGAFITQRLVPSMALLTARWVGEDALRLQAPGMPDLLVEVPPAGAELRGVRIWRESALMPDAGDDAAQWLSASLGRACRLVYLPRERAIQVDTGYASPGERTAFTDGFPFLLIGQASLDDLSRRVGRALPMTRFRPNLVVSGAEAYAEDQWRRIRIGTLEFRVVKPCSRCIITTIDPLSGLRGEDREPLATLQTYRKGEGGVFFGQNLIAEGEGELAVGMPVEILD
ncbi:MOSC domain-containing protein [Stutzerimonas nosocomialis]|uniref:MOSC domain-containing protein n=1 Tax=Stutzerimonas nosocomialis TaxID=1056496 RepID=A0A5R9QHU1_9GAMM|nr:MOSC domain-containing protein [Stutzerimonas nosocomialis]TLX53073.1 MOSC domain-containing protein [Stutzerimonas nosocomialis]TLX64618.1 MOSC domain-containing protein [Stutzerimonas nosocomialis]